jgi:hypothetical protein
MGCERNDGIVTFVERAIVSGDYAGMERVVNRSRWSMDENNHTESAFTESKTIQPDPTGSLVILIQKL